MLQINYPKDTKVLKELEKSYADSVCNDDLEEQLKRYFKQRTVPNPPTFRKLILMPIEKLFSESLRIGRYITTDLQKTKLKKIINYDTATRGYNTKRQPVIAKFFSSNDDKIKLLTCYYCNVDYIYAFANIGDYKSSLDFINKARKFELKCIKGIDDAKAKTIMAKRKNGKIATIDSLPKNITASDKTNIKGLIVKDKSNHFTLDHVLDKADFPLAALSFYNLVPSCYACNSKFKNQQKLIDKTNRLFLSPTSNTNSFLKEFAFKVLFSAGGAKPNMINKLEDILLDFNLSARKDDYELFLRTFKIHSRYVLHKREAFDLISKKQQYNDAHISQISKIVGISEDKIRRDIFGKHLFEGCLEDYPLTKLKRDVAKQIGVLGVK